MLLNLGMVATRKDKSADYTDYLGENYYRNYDFSKKKMFSSYVANHSAPCDIWIMFATL
jgi:1-acyl-sn-glycerol-3-phosphate acyltransferase